MGGAGRNAETKRQALSADTELLQDILTRIKNIEKKLDSSSDKNAKKRKA